MHPLADRITDLYERHADAYASDRQACAVVETAWLDRFAALLPPGGTVLDLGCGIGEPIAANLIGRGFRVDGVDASPSLIAHCRVRFPDQHWQVADMRGLDLGRTYAGILAWDSFFHLDHDDQRGMFAVFGRHAAAGTALMFTSGPAHGEAIGEYRGEPLYHASLAPEAYRALLAEHGFEVCAHRTEDPDCGGHTVWLARMRP
ncbi:MAG: SAM-dependent methyltransferase [Rhodanobacter denitrificans]|uniref:SAM-dependent methyltransferase n=1 Tax=Rhodanobacter denitrificans TaxID=666685 RepID=A0A2W5N065_9GAMM|nr:MAG: SAM-dependent methyltransferase [Rhodanobacter denitrificans]